MLRSMMDDSDYKIHQDVINKLWMVYSEHLFFSSSE